MALDALQRHLDIIAVSLIVDNFVVFDKSEANPNNNIMMRRAGLSSITFFLRLPLESLPSIPTVAALVRRGSPGGSDEKEIILQISFLPDSSYNLGMRNCKLSKKCETVDFLVFLLNF